MTNSLVTTSWKARRYFFNDRDRRRERRGRPVFRTSIAERRRAGHDGVLHHEGRQRRDESRGGRAHESHPARGRVLQGDDGEERGVRRERSRRGGQAREAARVQQPREARPSPRLARPRRRALRLILLPSRATRDRAPRGVFATTRRARAGWIRARRPRVVSSALRSSLPLRLVARLSLARDRSIRETDRARFPSYSHAQASHDARGGAGGD
eukprot:18389-Pelagococcus_subviridis.AAC.9